MEMLRKKLGDFYITELIGTGGMSQVFLGINPRTREKRAIKILAKRATSIPAVYARFQREVEIIRRLSHPNIVKILGSGTLEDCYYYMMEYMSGGSLSRRLEKSRMRLNEALPLFTVICRAMAHAHEQGIVHRDLKPANILLSESGVPMVSDFGIAKALDADAAALTRSNEIMGTIAYLAPEQRSNTKRVDRRADIYALGAILYEMLMGFPPLGKFPLPHEMLPDFPDEIEAVLAKCLSFRPDGRYLDARALLSEIEAFEISISARMSGGGTQIRERISKAATASPEDLDRIEGWFQTLRNGTTRERLLVVREMVERVDEREAKAILKLFASEEDKVRWGLIRVFGELKIQDATQMIIAELKNPFHRESAIEALGNIGSEEAFIPIRQFVIDNPHSAMMALVPLARTGGQKAIKYLKSYLSDEMSVVRQAAIKAISAIESTEAIEVLLEHLGREHDDRIRAAIQQSISVLESKLHRAENDVTARLA